MVKKYKKVYLEITNRCNLSCDFCIKNKRVVKDLSFDEFIFILDRLKSLTDYLYFHVLGEPLMHPFINEFIDYASLNFGVNITTNGYLINKIKNNKNIRQVNISLHSYDKKYNVSLEEYLSNIFDAIEVLLSNDTYVSLRLWTKNKYSDYIIKMLNEKYNCNIDDSNSYKIKEGLFMNKSEEFIWPDLDNDYYSEVGSCYGLLEHFGILSDGTVIPCCLDSKGIINLGNIYLDDLNQILSSKRCEKMREGFRNNKKIEELCRHCLFLRSIKK